jgi:hypothetical protein
MHHQYCIQVEEVAKRVMQPNRTLTVCETPMPQDTGLKSFCQIV